ncbi:nudix-type nucleoside diphosphatase, YffH/AdpP family [Devosia enhydra]|uniref:GDP-mannose pyrophosphatase n=1 Tax=Devosia enhydra TaxID=665118 RepID=A0A1K2HYV8_9HYPH|nr:NUDIX domain-containing protein [Devosia enhydra]SFZ85279.1 nudix-type nucleoside diphosphatase, YffH/AdpP family [Devosia enhydra]
MTSSDFGDKTRDGVTIIAHAEVFVGWGRITSTTIDLATGDGATVRQVREIYDHGHAACVLPYDRASGCVMLVRQFRLPPHLCGDEGWLLEVPAGLLDADAPEAAARREAAEETGLALGPMRLAFATYPSPGSLTEKVSCYIAPYTAADRIGPGGGLAEETEAIEVVEMAFAEAMTMIAHGRIIDAKTILLLQHLALSGEMTGTSAGFSDSR